MQVEVATNPFLALPRMVKRLIALAIDASLCVLCVWFAFYLRLNEFVALSGGVAIAVWVALALQLPIFAAMGLYRAIFRYSGWPALHAVIKACGVYAMLYSAIFTAYGIPDIPRTIGLIQPMLLFFAVGTSRAFARYWLGGLYRARLAKADLPKVLIYGAGGAGRQLAAAMANNFEMRVVGYLDDDLTLQGNLLNGLPIYNPRNLNDLVDSVGVCSVLLALPSISRQRRNKILNDLLKAKVSVRTLPSFTALAKGRFGFADLQELDVDDLLGRDPVAPNPVLLAKNITGKTVLVTGAGGSIGGELCRQIAQLSPSVLLLIEQSEFALYEIHQELLAKEYINCGGAIRMVPLLASVRDEGRMGDIMRTWRPDIVYHAAAYKHVPVVEHNPAEGIKNNVLGTLKTAEAAERCGVADFVLISTDKAVRPTNIMGASKRLAEMILQAFAANNSKTKFTMVRFGNVLGSSGSVVPKFRQQIRNGGPITLTHPDITRYFMTIPEAAQLVIQAGAMAKGGDVFVLDMGGAVKIIDLARRMIELSGLSVKDSENPDGDIEIEITGLRPGEKLYEELLIGDNPKPTSHPRIMKAHEDFIPLSDLVPKIKELESCLRFGDVEALRNIMQELVPEYSPAGDVVDWIHMEKLVSVPCCELVGS